MGVGVEEHIPLSTRFKTAISAEHDSSAAKMNETAGHVNALMH